MFSRRNLHLNWSKGNKMHLLFFHLKTSKGIKLWSRNKRCKNHIHNLFYACRCKWVLAHSNGWCTMQWQWRKHCPLQIQRLGLSQLRLFRTSGCSMLWDKFNCISLWNKIHAVWPHCPRDHFKTITLAYPLLFEAK